MLEIKNNIDHKCWSEYVISHPHGNIFQTPEMFEVYKNTVNYNPYLLAVVEEGEKILGLLLCVVIKEKTRILGNFTARSIIRGGPLIKNDNEEVFNLIIKEYNSFIKSKAIYSQFRNMWDTKTFYNSFSNNRYKYENHLDIIFDLTKGENFLFNNLDKMRKKGLKQATNRGLIIKRLSTLKEIDLNRIYKLLNSVYSKAKLPLAHFSLFENAIKFLYQKNYIQLWGAFIGNRMVGIRMVLCYNDLIYDWYAGAEYDSLYYRPNDILPWEIIKWGANNNYKLFDFGGAGKSTKPYGVRDYKMKFGGKLVEYGRFEKVHKRIIMNIGKNVFKIYRLLSGIRFKNFF